MALVEKNDIKQIFADQAPSIDKPASFANYPRGWDTARPNNGKPTIKQFNYLQQRTDQNILWMHQNGAALPYDATMEYAEGAVVVKDGGLQQYKNSAWVAVESASATAQSIAALRQLTPKNKGQVVDLISVNPDQNEGGGHFIATQKSGLVDDGGLIVASPDPLLFWVRINYDFVTPEMFGAADGDCYDALQKAFKHNYPTKLLPRTYKTSKTLWFGSGKKIEGAGHQLTVIEKTTNDTESTIGSRFAVDAVLLARHWTDADYTHYANLSGFLLTSSAIAKNTYGLYVPRLAESIFSNIKVATNLVNGIYSNDAWMISWDRCTASADNPWVILGGTSNTLTSCWATGAKGNSNSAYKLSNLYYSTLISCGADGNGLDGSPIKSIYNITNSSINMLSCGAESNHARKILDASGSRVSIDSLICMYFYNKYVLTNPPWNDLNVLFDVRSGSNFTLINSDIGLINTTFEVGITPSFINCSDSSVLNFENNKCNMKVSSVAINVAHTNFNISFNSLVNVRVDTGSLIVERMQANAPQMLETASKLYDTDKSIRSVADGTQENANLADTRGLGTFNFRALGTVANGYPVAGLFNVMQVGNSGTGTATNTTQLIVGVDNNRVGYKSGAWGSALRPFVEFRTTSNTTVDANGFIKNASPIVKLFSDRIELNEEAERQEISFEKLGVGNYLLKGSTGFAQESWYIETPKDANGNILFTVIYEQLENNDISVKTYKKKFDIETASIVADLDHPIDINEGRWIDIRLNE